MDTTIRDEVLKDFKESVSKIDFAKYNPKSDEFETALFTGLMYMILDKTQDDLATSYEESEDEISEEIHGAKKYLQRYMDTNEENYRKMASDELDHASFLLRKAYNKPIGNEDRSKLKKYESEIEQVRSYLSSR